MARKLEDNHSIATPVSVLRSGRSDIKHHPINALAEEMAALEAENERLRADLTAVLSWAQRIYPVIRDIHTDASLSNSVHAAFSRGQLAPLIEAAPAVVRQPGEGEAI